MKENVIRAIVAAMQCDLDCRQIAQLKTVLIKELQDVDIIENQADAVKRKDEKGDLLSAFISAKKIEGALL